jgi:hypothetical protein
MFKKQKPFPILKTISRVAGNGFRVAGNCFRYTASLYSYQSGYVAGNGFQDLESVSSHVSQKQILLQQTLWLVVASHCVTEA